MNDDFEQQLHEMLQERGATPMQSPQAPKKVLRRARRRQLSTGLVSGATAVLVIGGAILGAGALRSNTPPSTAETSTGSTRTVVFDGYGVTYPYDWALQSVSSGISWIPPVGPEQPVPADGTTGGDTAAGAREELAASGQYLQLSNLYPDHLLDLTCEGTDLGATGVALQIQMLFDQSGGGDAALDQSERCADGSTLYTGRAATDHLAFGATARIGAEASQADRDALFDAFDSIEYPNGDTGVVGGSQVGSVGVGVAEAPTSDDDPAGGRNGGGTQTAPDYVSTVVAGGTTDGGAQWVMTVDGAGGGGSITYDNMGFGWASAVSSDGETPPMPDLDASVMPFGPNQPAVVFGSVAGSATRLEVRPDDGDAIDVPLLAAPSVTGIDRSYFLTELGDLPSKTGSVVALDADGAAVATTDYDLKYGNSSPGDPGCLVPEPADGAEGAVVCDPPPICPKGDGNAPAEICSPIPCPDTPVSSDDQDGTTKTCIVDPPICDPAPVPEDPTNGSEDPAPGDCWPPPTCPDQPVGSDGNTSSNGREEATECTVIVPPTCVEPDPGTGTTAPAEDPNGEGGDSPPSAGCSFGGGSDGNPGQEPVPVCDPQPGDVVCFANPEPAGTTGR